MIRSTSRKILAAGALVSAIALAAPGVANADAVTGWVGPAGSNGSGVQFLNTSTIINSPNLTAQSKIYSIFGQAVAPGDIGVRARLFKSGVLCEAIDYKYNLTPVAELTIGTTKNCGTGSYNSHGFTAVWDGTSSYRQALTFPSNPLNYTAPAARSTAPSADIDLDNGVNDLGQSYGTGNSANESELPDLIAAISDNGEIGYVLKTDLDSDVAATPAEAAAAGDNSRTITVYAEDGTTTIGQFTVS